MPPRSLKWLTLLLLVGVTTPAGAGETPEPRRAAEGVLVGPAPETPEAWDRLAALGVRTVVGVDGPAPDAKAAGRHAIRVVHVPLGYDGVERAEALALGRVAEECERPLYVFCHHGKHRGPAAAAIVCRAAGLLDAAGSKKLLEEAGTSRDYAGLWSSVAAFEPRRAGERAPELVERCEIDPLPLAMAHLDRAWDASQRPSSDEGRRLALVAAAQALKESRRAVAPDRADLLRRFDEATALLKAAQAAKGDARRAAAAAFAEACAACHAAHRD